MGIVTTVRDEGADLGGAHADVLHGAQRVAEAAEVADTDRLIDDEGQGPDEVLDRLLRTQGQREAADAERGQAGRDVDVERVERGDDGDGYERRLGRPAGETDDRHGAIAVARRHAGGAEPAEGIDDPPKEPGQGDPGDDLGAARGEPPRDDGRADEDAADLKEDRRQDQSRRQEACLEERGASTGPEACRRSSQRGGEDRHREPAGRQRDQCEHRDSEPMPCWRAPKAGIGQHAR